MTKYNWHNNKSRDGLVNRLSSNLVILNQFHRVAIWLIEQEKILKQVGELDKEIIPVRNWHVTDCTLNAWHNLKRYNLKFIALHCHAILQTKEVVSPNDTIVECIMCSLM